ncbi:MAG TPA: SulP family inorganic anion transporter, partial [Panacibacter sp.]|nr:SulP family inorganic anion transporter [Panacibacter sp.]
MNISKRKIKFYYLILRNHDLPAGLTVFLVALPLCLGIALASGAPLQAGIISGIIGGIIVPLISRSALSVSGPGAGLTTVVAASIAASGSYDAFLLCVIIAGILQLLMGIFRLGGFAGYFPSAVIKGMLSAIGLILISKQIPIALGYEQPDFWSNTFGHIFNLTQFFTDISNINHQSQRGTILITLVSLFLIIFFNHPKYKRLSIIPAPLLVVLAGVGLKILFDYFFPSLQLHHTQLVTVPDPFFANMHFPDWSKFSLEASLWKNGIIIGILATLETLLCIEAIDKLDPYNRLTPANRELMAQGAGNIVCGLLGALPVTAVIVRGSANINAGARSNLSAFLHGLFLLTAVATIPFALNQIPYASLAAILLITGYNLTKPVLYKNIYRLGWNQFMPFAITIIVILFTDLLAGVSIGLILSAYFIIRNNFKAEYKVSEHKIHETAVYTIKLNSMVTFLNKVALNKALDKIPEYSIAVIDGLDSRFIDPDVVEIIMDFESKAHRKHIQLELKGIQKIK